MGASCISVLAFADVPNATSHNRVSTESIVVTMEGCIESFKENQKGTKKSLSSEEFSLLSVAYCSCLADASRANQILEPKKVAAKCMRESTTMVGQVISKGKDVAFVNVSNPSEPTSLQVMKFYLKCLSSNEINLSSDTKGFWCSCIGDNLMLKSIEEWESIRAITETYKSKKNVCRSFAMAQNANSAKLPSRASHSK